MTVRAVPLLMTDDEATAAMVRAALELMMSSPTSEPRRIEVFPVLGIGELRPGDDLAGLIAERAPRLRDGDVLVVTSKAVSKVEGRLRQRSTSADPARARGRAAGGDRRRDGPGGGRRGTTLRIVETRHGLVLAAAGVDVSNVAPRRAGAAAAGPGRLRRRLLRRACASGWASRSAVIVSDSMGRPWRDGITDTAIGVAGITAVTDPRGRTDVYGNVLAVTQVAVADEIAAAADLVKGKLRGVPVAVVRGLALDGKLDDDGTRQPRAHPRPGRRPVPARHRRGDRGRPRRTPAGRPSRRTPLHADAVDDHRGAAGPDRGRTARCGRRSSASWPPGPTRCGAPARPGHLTASALVRRPDRSGWCC